MKKVRSKCLRRQSVRWIAYNITVYYFLRPTNQKKLLKAVILKYFVFGSKGYASDETAQPDLVMMLIGGWFKFIIIALCRYILNDSRKRQFK